MTQLLWYYAKVLAKTKNDNTNLETQLKKGSAGYKGHYKGLIELHFDYCSAVRGGLTRQLSEKL